MKVGGYIKKQTCEIYLSKGKAAACDPHLVPENP